MQFEAFVFWDVMQRWLVAGYQLYINGSLKSHTMCPFLEIGKSQQVICDIPIVEDHNDDDHEEKEEEGVEDDDDREEEEEMMTCNCNEILLQYSVNKNATDFFCHAEH